MENMQHRNKGLFKQLKNHLIDSVITLLRTQVTLDSDLFSAHES